MHKRKWDREFLWMTVLICLCAVLDFNLTLLFLTDSVGDELNPIARELLISEQYLELGIFKLLSVFTLIGCFFVVMMHRPKFYYCYAALIAAINCFIIVWWSIKLWT